MPKKLETTTPVTLAVEIIQALGGSHSVAAMCHLSDQAVSRWRHLGIPRGWLMFLRELGPEGFDWSTVTNEMIQKTSLRGGGKPARRPTEDVS